jgi:hypothetical protein
MKLCKGSPMASRSLQITHLIQTFCREFLIGWAVGTYLHCITVKTGENHEEQSIPSVTLSGKKTECQTLRNHQVSITIICSIIFKNFWRGGGTRAWTQVLRFARQVHYPWAMSLAYSFPSQLYSWLKCSK